MLIASSTPGERNEIVGATERELILQIDGQQRVTSWSAVTGISAGRAELYPGTGAEMLLLALELELDGETHLFISGEVEQAWLPLTAAMHLALPNTEPFETWAPAAIMSPEPLELFQRTDIFS